MYMYIIEYEIKVFFTQLEQNTLIIPLVSTYTCPLGSYRRKTDDYWIPLLVKEKNLVNF